MKQRNYLRLMFLWIGLMLCAQTALGQEADDLQAAFDAMPQTRAGQEIVVDLSKFSGLNRSRPLYIRNGGSYRIINGTLWRTAELTDSAIVIISGGSSVMFGEGVIISGNDRYTGHELVFVEEGSSLFVDDGARFCSRRISNDGAALGLPSYYEDFAILNEGNTEIMSGDLFWSRGIVNRGRLFSYRVCCPQIITYSNVSISEADGQPAPPVITLLNSSAKVNFSTLQTGIGVTLCEKDICDGLVVATGYFEEADADNLHLSIIANEADAFRVEPFVKPINTQWKLSIEGSQLVVRKKDNKVRTEEELKTALLNAANTVADTTFIEIEGNIEISAALHIPASKNIKITGGMLLRKEGFQGNMFVVDEHASLTFENIAVDGNRFKFEGQTVYSAFTIDYCSKIVFGKNANIGSHRVSNEEKEGLVTGMPRCKGAEIVIDGANFVGNEILTAPMFTALGGYNVKITMKSGRILDNIAMLQIADKVEYFELAGGSIGGDAFYDRGGLSTIAVFQGQFTEALIVGVSLKVQNRIIWGENVRTQSGDVNSEVLLNVKANGTSAYIMQIAPLIQDMVLDYYGESSLLKDGTVVVSTENDYKLTEEDLAHYKYTNDKWELALDKDNNQIVLKSKKIENFDDLQDFFDQLGQSENEEDKGTEKDPIDLVFGEEPVEVRESINIPEGAHVRFTGGQLIVPIVRSGPDTPVLTIPSSSSLKLSGTTLDVQQMTTTETLIDVSGKLVIDVECVIKVHVNLNGGSVIHVKPEGTLEVEGGEIRDNTAGDKGLIHTQGTTIINHTTIINNYGGDRGIIYVDGGNFYFNGGDIINNTTTNGVIYVEKNSYFYFNGGTVSGNQGSGSCGGIHVSYDSHFYFNGGYSYDNGDNGHYWDGTIYIGPDYNNEDWIDLGPHNIIRLVGKLEIEIRLHLRYEFIVSGTIVAQGTADYALTEDDLAKFVCDNDDWTFILRDGNIEAWLKSALSVEGALDAGRQATVSGGVLRLSGFPAGTEYAVYSASGALVANGQTSGDEHLLQLPDKGLYLVQCGGNSYKLNNR